MKIGMIIHSETGHTMGIANEIEKALEADGHTVEIRGVVPKSKRPWKEHAPVLQEIPDPQGYDVLVLGAPVWGFTLSHVMREYLYQVGPLEAKRLVIFSTGALPRFFGGKCAMRKMASLSGMPESKTVLAGAARFPRKKKPRHIDKVVKRAIEAVSEMA